MDVTNVLVRVLHHVVTRPLTFTRLTKKVFGSEVDIFTLRLPTHFGCNGLSSIQQHNVFKTQTDFSSERPRRVIFNKKSVNIQMLSFNLDCDENILHQRGVEIDDLNIRSPSSQFDITLS